jgi:nucleoside-diphosphate-sugar epimerase
MKVGVTGWLGKAGRWIVRELASSADGREAHDILVFDRTAHPKEAGVRYLAGDILDLGQVFEVIAGSDVVIHLAGIPTNGVATEEATVRTNVMGTFNVHEAAWRLGIRHVVTMGSEAVLGWSPTGWVREVPPEYLPIDEDHPLRPQDAYGVSKLAAEVIVRSFTDKAGLNTLILRPPRIVSPDELEQLRASDGVKPVRFGLFHYIDARDLADFCRLAIERPLSGCNALFVGSGESILREPLCSVFPRLMPAIGEKAAALTDGVGAVSIAKAKTLLGWVPKHSWRNASSGGR